MIDTRTDAQVASDANENLFGDACRGKAQTLPAMTLRSSDFINYPTEPEYEALEALRLWTHAQTNPLVHARLSALRDMAYVLALFDSGDRAMLSEYFKEHHPAEIALYLAMHQLHGILTGRSYKVDAPGRELPSADLLPIYMGQDETEGGA